MGAFFKVSINIFGKQSKRELIELNISLASNEMADFFLPIFFQFLRCAYNSS